jgi:hypothetical protein
LTKQIIMPNGRYSNNSLWKQQIFRVSGEWELRSPQILLGESEEVQDLPALGKNRRSSQGESSVREADLVCGTINEAQGSGQQGPSLLWRRGSKKGVAKRILSEKKSKTELRKNSTPKRVSPANKRLSALAQAFAPPQFELTVDLLPFSGSVRPVPPTQTLSQNILNLVDYPQKLLDFCTCLLIF